MASHRFGREGLAALSGILLALSFPKFGTGPIAFVALVPLLVALAGASPARALRLGYLTGAVSAVGILYWTALVVIQYGGLSLPVGLTVMGLLCLAVALFPALFGWMMGRWLGVLGPRALLAAPVAWVATEVLRAYTFFRFPWCLLGYSQHDDPAFLQLAAFASVYGVSFLIVTVSSLLAHALVVAGPARRLGSVAAAVSVLAAGWGYGTWVLSRPLPDGPRIRVGLVQASVLQGEKWDPAMAWENVDRHLALSRRAAAEGARLVVWPESALPSFFDRAPALAAELRRLARQDNVYLLFGNDDVEQPAHGRPRYYVGAKLLTPDGRLALRYHKIHLVPFGEYVPLHSLLTLGGRVAAKLVQQVADFTPGTEAVTAEVDGHRLGAFICYEAIFPELTRRFTDEGAQLLVNITNDAWYGRTSAPYQHFAMARFRAVESGTYLVRAANTGITAIVDPRGRVLARTRLFERTVLVGEVPFLKGGTPYSRYGDAFPWACLAAAVLATAASFRRSAAGGGR